MELAIRWSPASTPADAQFLIADVAGHAFRLCRVRGPADDDDGGGGGLRWDETARTARAPSFRAFDWAPQHDLVAVGQWSGATAVLGLRDPARALALPLRSQRPCNAVSFGPDARLATGLERVRNDFCLHVFDLQQWARAPPSAGSATDGGGSGGGTPKPPAVEPVRRLATSEAITSIKFVPAQPQLLVAGVKGACVRVYDLRDGAAAPALQFHTPCVHNLAVDPRDPNSFASARPARDALVHVWDCRAAARPPGAGGAGASSAPPSALHDVPVLELRDVFGAARDAEPASVWSLRYAVAEPGSLGILGSHGRLRVVRTKKDFVDGDDAAEQPRPVSVGRSYDMGGPAEDRILAFDFTNVLTARARPCAVTLRGAQDVRVQELRGPPPALATSVRASVAMSGGRSSADPEEGNGMGGLMIKDPGDGDVAGALARIRAKLEGRSSGHENQRELQNGAETNGFVSEGWNDDALSASKSNDSREDSAMARDALPGSVHDALLLADLPRRRCVEGYLFDADKNRQIARDDERLQWMWDWLTTAKEIAENGNMASREIDFSYLGVDCIWNEDLGPSPACRSQSDPRHVDFSDAVEELVTALELPDIPLPETSKPFHRRLCLHTLGLFPPTTDTGPSDPRLEHVKTLALSGRGHEGALRATLFSRPALAATALRSGPRPHQDPALALLLSLHGDRAAPPDLDAQIAALAATATSPHARALLAHLAGSVPRPHPRLPPRYPLASALLLLPDAALTAHLRSARRAAVAAGDPAELPLVGLAPPHAPALLAAYLARTADLPTAALACAPAVPRYGPDPRVAAWRAALGAQLRAHRLFLARARFDAQAARLAAPASTAPDVTTAAPRQVALRCANCDAALHRTAPATAGAGADANPATPASAKLGGGGGGTAARAGGVLGGAGPGAACAACGARWPRCAVCDLWVGGAEPGEARRDPRRSSGGGATSTAGAEDGGGAGDGLAGMIHACLRCAHVYHRGHASAWFARHAACAAVGCRCRCDDGGPDAAAVGVAA